MCVVNQTHRINHNPRTVKIPEAINPITASCYSPRTKLIVDVLRWRGRRHRRQVEERKRRRHLNSWMLHRRIIGKGNFVQDRFYQKLCILDKHLKTILFICSCYFAFETLGIVCECFKMTVLCM